MPSVTITPGNVTVVSDHHLTKATGGATLTAGQFAYKDAGDNNELKAGAVTTEAAANVVGYLHGPTSDGKTAHYAATNGTEVAGGSFTKGTWYVLGAAGIIQEYSDLSGGEYITWLGYGNTAGNLVLYIIATGETK